MFAKHKSVIYESLMFILGCYIWCRPDAFVLPHKLVSTGISGVGLILYYVTGFIRWFLEYDFSHSHILGCLEVAGHPCCYQKPCMALIDDGLGWLIYLILTI